MSTRAKRQRRRASQTNILPRRPRRISFAGDLPRITWPKLQTAFLLLEEDVFQRLQNTAARHGVTYQRLLEVILREHLGKY